MVRHCLRPLTTHLLTIHHSLVSARRVSWQTGVDVRGQRFSGRFGQLLFRLHMLAEKELRAGLSAQLVEDLGELQLHFLLDAFLLQLGSLLVVQNGRLIRLDVLDAFDDDESLRMLCQIEGRVPDYCG